MKRWRKVALGEMERGKLPNEREFVAALIPEMVVVDILAKLQGAKDTNSVKAIFSEAHNAFS